MAHNLKHLYDVDHGHFTYVVSYDADKDTIVIDGGASFAELSLGGGRLSYTAVTELIASLHSTLKHGG
jgi:hypothetical protein